MKPNIFIDFKKTQFWHQPRSDPILLLKSTGICFTSHLRLPSRPPAGQHMRQHGENEKKQSQNLSESEVFVEI